MTRRPNPELAGTDWQHIAETAQHLANLAGLLGHRLDQWTRGGHPTRSISDGPTGGDPPLPLPDTTDRQLEQAATNYTQTARDIRRQLDWLYTRTLAWTTPAQPLPDPEPITCTSPACTHQCRQTGNDRTRRSPLDGQPVCPACWQHERRTGLRRNRTRDTTT